MLLSGCGGTQIDMNSGSDTSSESVQSGDSSSNAPVSETDATSSQSKQVTVSGTASSVTDKSVVTTSSSRSETVSSEDQRTEKTTTSTASSDPEMTHSTTVQTSKKESDNVDLSAEINSYFEPIRNSGAKYSVKVISVAGKSIVEAGGCNTKMVSASLIKLYVAAAVYEQMDRLVSAEAYNGETEQLVINMISYSDNNACNNLVKRLGSGDGKAGMNEINRFCISHGYKNTSMSRLMLDFNGLENYTTTDDCCRILRAFYNNELKGSQKIIDYMKRQHTRTKIPMGITDGTVVANKTGELAAVENDSAIVYAKTGPYIICVMTCGLSNTASARNSIILTASAVHKYILNNRV